MADLFQARFLLDGKRLLLLGERDVAVYSVDDHSKQSVATLPLTPLVMRIAPGGRGAVIASKSGSGPYSFDRYTWIGLHGKVRALRKVNDFWMLASDLPGRYAFFVDKVDAGSGGRRFYSLALGSGAVRSVMTLPRDVSYLTIRISPESSEALVFGEQGGRSKAWLVPAAAGKPRVVGSGGFVTASFSPSGEWIAVSATRPGSGRPPRARLEPVATDGSSTRDAGSGFQPVWAP